MKRIYLLIKTALSMLLRPNNWTIYNDAKFDYAIETTDGNIGFRAEKMVIDDKTGVREKHFSVVELYAPGAPDDVFVPILTMRWVWIILVKWVVYRSEVDVSKYNAAELMNIINNHNAK